MVQRLQRLAHRRVVRHPPRPLHPVRAARDLGPAGARRRGAAHRGEGRPRGHVLGEPVEARLAEHPLRPLGPVLAGVLATSRSSCACTSGRRRRWSITVAGRADRLPDHAARRSTSCRPPPTSCGRRCSGSSPTSRSRCPRAGSAGSRTSSSGSTTSTASTTSGPGRTSATSCPSEVFDEHVLTCFIDDRFGVASRDVPEHGPRDVGVRLPALGLDVAVRARAGRRALRSASATHDIDRITHLNAMRHFSYDPFTDAGRAGELHRRRAAGERRRPRRRDPVHQRLEGRRPRHPRHRPRRPEVGNALPVLAALPETCPRVVRPERTWVHVRFVLPQ